MGCAKGDEGNATPQRDAHPGQSISAVAASPAAAQSSFAGPSGDASRPLRKEPDKAARPQSLVPLGCSKIGRSPRYTPWHRRPSYDLRRAPCDHPDFISNALREGLFRGSLRGCGRRFGAMYQNRKDGLDIHPPGISLGSLNKFPEALLHPPGTIQRFQLFYRISPPKNPRPLPEGDI